MEVSCASNTNDCVGQDMVNWVRSRTAETMEVGCCTVIECAKFSRKSIVPAGLAGIEKTLKVSHILFTLHRRLPSQPATTTTLLLPFQPATLVHSGWKSLWAWIIDSLYGALTIPQFPETHCTNVMRLPFTVWPGFCFRQGLR